MAFWAAPLLAKLGIGATGATAGTTAGGLGALMPGLVKSTGMGMAKTAPMAGKAASAAAPAAASGGDFWGQFKGMFSNPQEAMEQANTLSQRQDAALMRMAHTFGPRDPIQQLQRPYAGGQTQPNQNPGITQLGQLLADISRRRGGRY